MLNKIEGWMHCIIGSGFVKISCFMGQGNIFIPWADHIILLRTSSVYGSRRKKIIKLVVIIVESHHVDLI